MKHGNLDIIIDKFTSCLEDANGNLYDTVVYQVEESNILKGYNRTTGWKANWKLLYKKGFKIFALALKDSPLVFQGLVAVYNDYEAGVTILDWAVANPKNVPYMNKGKKVYFGVGGHLFAIALEESIRAGFGGVIIGHPSNRKLNEHYIEKLHAKPFNYGPLADGYQYTIILAGMDARYVYEKYNFESIDKIKK